MNSAATTFDGENKYLRITDIDEASSKYIPNVPVSPEGDLEDKYLVKENDILFARTGASTGKSYLYNINDGKLYFAGFLIKVKVNYLNNANFIFNQTKTNHYQKWVTVMSMRSGQPGINSKEYASFKFWIPSKSEQDKIASFLTVIDKRIETQSKIIENLESLMLGLRQKIFSQQLRFNNYNGSGFLNWETKRLGEVCEIIGGGTPPTNKKAYWGGNIQWFTPTEIKENYVSKSERTITKLGLEKSSAKLLPEGTILLTTRATIGEVAIAMEECTTNQGFQSLVVNKYTNNNFIFNWIKQNKRELIKRANGSTFSEISKSEIEKILITLPCFKEQNEIANFLSSFDKKIEMEKLILAQYQQQKKHLLQNLFI